jgi:hypothetical protein
MGDGAANWAANGTADKSQLVDLDALTKRFVKSRTPFALRAARPDSIAKASAHLSWLRFHQQLNAETTPQNRAQIT